MHKYLSNLLINGQILLSYTIFHLDFAWFISPILAILFSTFLKVYMH